jgi:hypothetical protein
VSKVTLLIPTPQSPNRLVRENIERILNALCCERDGMRADPERAYEAEVMILALGALGTKLLKEEFDRELYNRLTTCVACALRSGDKWIDCRPLYTPPCPFGKQNAPA